MKNTYKIIAILLSLFVAESSLAIGALQYAALGSENIVETLLKKAAEGENLNAIEKYKVNANIYSLQFTQPKTAEKYKNMIRDNKTLSKMFPLFKETSPVKKQVTQTQLLTETERFEKKYKENVKNFQNNPNKENAENVLIFKNVAIETDQTIKDTNFINITNDVDTNYFKAKGNDILVDLNKISNINTTTVDKESSYYFDEIFSRTQAKPEDIVALQETLRNKISNEIDILKFKSLPEKMGDLSGYASIGNQLSEILKKFDSLPSKSFEQINNFNFTFEQTYLQLETLIVDDFVDNTTKEYKNKTPAKYKIWGQSKVHKSLKEWIQIINNYTTSNTTQKVDDNLYADLKHFLLNYTDELNTKNIQLIFNEKFKNYYNEEIKNKFNANVKEYILALDETGQSNDYGLYTFINKIHSYIIKLKTLNQDEIAAEYTETIFKPLINRFDKVRIAFKPYFNSDVNDAYEKLLTNLWNKEEDL